MWSEDKLALHTGSESVVMVQFQVAGASGSARWTVTRTRLAQTSSSTLSSSYPESLGVVVLVPST